MIKAKELEFEDLRAEICDGLYFEIEDFCDAHATDSSLGEGWIAGLYASDSATAVCIWYEDRLKNAFDAVAACQNHYQQMVENMVDMEHLNKIIMSAIAHGFWRGDGRFGDGNEDDLCEAQEEFLKSLEEEKQ